MNKEQFAAYIKKLRLDNNLTIKEIEERTGISNSYISMIETGKRDIPSPDILKKLSPLYNVPYIDLMLAAEHISINDIANKVGVSKTYVEKALKDESHKFHSAYKKLVEESFEKENSKFNLSAEKLELLERLDNLSIEYIEVAADLQKTGISIESLRKMIEVLEGLKK